MRTINKKSNEAKMIFSEATTCRVICKENNYKGQPCDPNVARKELERFRFAKLRDHGEHQYRVRVTADCWYELISRCGAEQIHRIQAIVKRALKD